MDLHAFEAASPLIGTGKDLPHLAGPAASIRQVLAAHFVRQCPHVVEIGGHIRPITPYLTHHPLTVLSVDPKTEPFAAEELNGHPCRIRHVNRKFQEISYDYAPGSYGLVLLGYSLKPYGRQEPLGKLLYSLIDNARVAVIEYPPALERAAAQLPRILDRHHRAELCRFDIELKDASIDGSPYTKRRFHVLEPFAAKD